MNTDFDRALQSNAYHVLSRDYSQVTPIQLEGEIYQKKKQLLSSKEHLERLTSQLHLTQQQIDLFKHETQVATEKIKDVNWHFTKEACAELARVTEPSQTLLELSEKFMFLLDQKDRSWKTFKVLLIQAILKNFGPLKALMNSISADHLSEEQLNQLLPVWKNQHTIQASLQKTARGAAIISEWISHCVEYKLKKETLNTSLKNVPELERKVKKAMTSIAVKTEDISALEQRLEEIKTRIDAYGSQESGEKLSFAELSISSLRSTAIVQKSRVEELPPIEPFVRGLPQSPPNHRKIEFPNFSSEQLYEETPAASRREEEEFQIDFEESSEYCGGCRGKYFCM